MKKLVPLLIAAAGVAAYLVIKNKKEEDKEEIKIISLDEPESESGDEAEPDKNEEIAEELQYPEESAILRMQYPSLPLSFIEEVLEHAEGFNESYPIDSFVKVNHVAKFIRAEEMIEFVKRIQEGNYAFQEAAEENTLLVTRDCAVTEGSLLEEVLRIANLVNELGGEYFGFRIDKR